VLTSLVQEAPAAGLTLLSAEGLTALVTLTALEVVLGIDNIVFLAILTGKLDARHQPLARRLGLGLALLGRVFLLLAVGWLMTLTRPLFAVLGQDFSGKDLILLGGGLFLVAKATVELHQHVEGRNLERVQGRGGATFGVVIAQVVAMDLIFSLDSVLTAVGMVTTEQGAGGDALIIMVLAVTIAIAVMMAFAGPIAGFVERNPSLKVLALAFLVLIGVLLTADGLGRHLPRGYVYAAMAFSLAVDLLQMRADAKAKILRGKAAPG
jgi:predicted tellurium resistance membrane protein TerC